MDLYPAIDLRGGRVVRLTEGDFDQETHYPGEPVALAKHFASQGAPWIHVVDLDAAKGDGPVNADTIKAIAAAVDVPVQAGGGQTDDTSLKAGVKRIVLGSLAISDPDAAKALVRAYPGRVAIGLDHREGRIAVRGWQEESDRTVDDVIADYADVDVAAFVVTNIATDGKLTGPDLAGLERVLLLTRVPVIASGGVATLDDIRALRTLDVNGRGVAGVITGRAVYENNFSVAEAVAACG
ncbi:MAG TPA: 1-(5-phosphoribosyl)-5-[(5-phosphoribosylamino)methylideneamino] imidazole-4-carboxamide isomerase [Acidimicrobiales bacterium]|nr:1-(5-phosphoribosyl)-5-[(5-phosphoribosylamino)methylideneamino] imidazole-4-carboxamide isomerase [Acidimicrobiales bacterium]